MLVFFSRVSRKAVFEEVNNGLFTTDKSNAFFLGMAIVAPGSVKPALKIRASVYILTKEEGGTGKPLKHMGQNMVFARTFDCMASTNYLNPDDRIMPGENGEMNLIFRVPMVIEKSDRFTIRCGSTTIGTGVVTDIIDDVTEKQVEEWFTMKAHLKTAI